MKLNMILLTGLFAGPETNWGRGLLDVPIAFGVLGAVVLLIGTAIYMIVRRS